MIEQCPIAFFNRAKLIKEVRKLIDQIAVNLLDLLHLLSVITVMRQMMMPIVHINHRVRAITSCVTEHVRRNARSIRTKSQN